MKRIFALFLVFYLLLPPVQAAEASGVAVRSAWEHGLELVLPGLSEGKLIAAAYRGSRMTAIGTADISAGTETAELTFSQALQENDRVKVFLVNPGSMAPLMPVAALTVPQLTEQKPDPDPEPEGSEIMVVYFSATGNTEAVAEKIASASGGALAAITPEDPYTSADLDYNSDCRANREQNDPAARPAISSGITGLKDCDVIFLGYPIWWGQAPKIMYTFVESYDLSGKTVIPFCTSGSSGVGSSAANLQKAAGGTSVTWDGGRRFSGSASDADVKSWVEETLKKYRKEEETTVEKLKIEANGSTFTAVFENNSSAEEFKALLRKGPVTVQMNDYGNFEKVGPLGHTLTRNDTSITTEPGDVILYQGNQITVYYDVNTWSFTRLAKIENATRQSLLDAFGSGSVSITFSLA